MWYNLCMNTNTPIVSLVVAMSTCTRAIGKHNDLLWRIPEDQRHFKAVTMGHPVIMGRKTYESIGHPLPGRTNIVLTRNKTLRIDGVTVCHTFSEALETARHMDTKELCVIGGEAVFRDALPFTDRIYLTFIDDAQEGDAYFPEFDQSAFTETARREGEYEGVRYAIVTFDRM